MQKNLFNLKLCVISVDNMICQFTFFVDFFFYARCYHASVANKIYLFINKVQSDQVTSQSECLPKKTYIKLLYFFHTNTEKRAV